MKSLKHPTKGFGRVTDTEAEKLVKHHGWNYCSKSEAKGRITVPAEAVEEQKA